VLFLSAYLLVLLAHAAAVVPGVGECQMIGSGILSTFIGVDSMLLDFTMTEWVLILIFKQLMAATKRWTSVAQRNSPSEMAQRSTFPSR